MRKTGCLIAALFAASLMSTTAGADDKAAAARANGAKFFAGLVTFGTATMAAPAAPAKKAAKRSKKKKM